MSESLSERVLADAREQIAEKLRVEIWTVKIAGLSDQEAFHLADAVLPILVEAVVADRLALTTQIKARLESESSWVDPQLRFDLVALVEGAAPTSEQPDAEGRP